MLEIVITDEIACRVEKIALSCIECDVVIEEKNEKLWQLITSEISELNSHFNVEGISKLPAISASRKAYKVCGKDPARYRLSAEALLRRAVKRNEIYQVNNVVDLLNLVSIKTGFSIGGYDVSKISGKIKMGVGQNNEPYKGIGRGDLNIEGMPVFRDENGAFGTSTSDSVRTCVDLSTSRFLMIIVDYGAREGLDEASELAVGLLKTFAGAENIEIKKIS